MKKIVILVMLFVLTAFTMSSNISKQDIKEKTVYMNQNQNIYTEVLNSFKEPVIDINEKDQTVDLSGTVNQKVPLSGDKKQDVHYSFRYDKTTNLVTIKVDYCKDNKEKTSELLHGVPFKNSKNVIDIAFSYSGNVFYLSDIQKNLLLDNCNFDQFLRDITPFVQTVAVVTVVVIAAPAVVAAIPALGGAALAGGGVATIVSGGGLAAGLAAAGSTAAIAIPVATGVTATYGGAIAASNAVREHNIRELQKKRNEELRKREQEEREAVRKQQDSFVHDNDVEIDDKTLEECGITVSEYKSLDKNCKKFLNQMIKNQRELFNKRFPIGEILEENLPVNVLSAFRKYCLNNWGSSIFSNPNSKAKFNMKYCNADERLPIRDANGNKIEYKEFDVDDTNNARERGQNRLYKDNLGNYYFSNDHHLSFVQIITNKICKEVS